MTRRTLPTPLPLADIIDNARDHFEQASGYMAVMSTHRPEPELLALHRTADKIMQFSNNLERLIEEELKRAIEKRI